MQAGRPPSQVEAPRDQYQDDVALSLCHEPSPKSVCVGGDYVVMVIRPVTRTLQLPGADLRLRRRGWGSGQGRHLGFSPPWSLGCLYLIPFLVYSC